MGISGRETALAWAVQRESDPSCRDLAKSWCGGGKKKSKSFAVRKVMQGAEADKGGFPPCHVTMFGMGC